MYFMYTYNFYNGVLYNLPSALIYFVLFYYYNVGEKVSKFGIEKTFDKYF